MTVTEERDTILVTVREETGENVTDFEGAERVGGESIRPAPGVSVSANQRDNLDALVEDLLMVDVEPENFKELSTFEEMFAALYAWKFKTMIRKQKDYGPENISKAGESGITIRLQDKVERLKVLIGNAEKQVESLKTLLDTEEPETLTELNTFINKMEDVLYPKAENESVLDTWGDAGNYGDIGVTVHVGAWPKPLES